MEETSVRIVIVEDDKVIREGYRFLIGEKQGLSNKAHFSGSFSFIVIVTLVIFVILDLNQPRRGLIRVSQDSLERVIQSMTK